MNYVQLAARTALFRVQMRRQGVSGGLVTVEGWLPVLHGAGQVHLGRVALRSFTARIELGAERGGRLNVGDGVFINQGASVVASLEIDIGPGARIGDFAAIFDSDHHPVEQGAVIRRAPVVIGANAWIGRGAMVLPGVTVGDHAVVAAGSIVTRDVPSRTLVAGNPARPVRELNADQAWRRP
jgi:acetyltransferase-like isoleucine patch superfamily enzyme